MAEYNKPCNVCRVRIRISNSTGKWLPYDLDGSIHNCKCNPGNQTEHSEKVTELIELVDMEERMEHAATICTEIRSKVSELELIIIGGGEQISK